MKKVRILILPILSGFYLVLGGCSFPVNVNPDPVPPLSEKIDLSVGLLIDDAQIRSIHSQSGLCLIGMAHTWNIETGAALRVGAEKTFRRVFTDVEILGEISEFTNKPLTLLITPKIERFNVSQSLTAELHLHCKLVNQAGEAVYENTISAKGSNQAGLGCLFGVAVGKKALSDTSNEAFNQGFVFLANDIIKKIDFSVYLKAKTL